MNNIFSEVQSWLNQPFNSSMSAAGWFWFIGLLIAISVLWTFIARHMKLAEL